MGCLDFFPKGVKNSEFAWKILDPHSDYAVIMGFPWSAKKYICDSTS